jgi:hypothetical protein
MRGIKIGHTHFFALCRRSYSDEYCKKQYERITGKKYKEETEKCDIFFGIKIRHFKLGLKLNYKLGEGYDGLYLYFGFWYAVFGIYTEKRSVI